MKILLVQESDWLKRNPHQQHHLMERLTLKGHVVHVIDYCIDWSREGRRGLFDPTCVYDGVNKIYPAAKVMVIRPSSLRLPVLEYFYLVRSHWREIEKQILEFKPDRIVGFGILNTYIASVLARKYGIPFIYYWIDVLHTLLPLKSLQPWAEYLERVTIKNSATVVTINKKLEDYVITLGASSKKTRLIKAGIDVGHFNPSIDGSAVRKKYGIGEDDLVLLFIGWLYHFSGIKEVAREVSRLRGQRQDVKLLIVGDGDACGDLEAIVREEGSGSSVILAGKQPYAIIPEFVAAADICLLPAYRREKIMQDIVPIKMYEYMAMEKPVIATRLPGVVNEFGEDNGVVYIDEPEEAVARALELKESGDLRRLGKKAGVFARKNDWDDITRSFEHELVCLRENDQAPANAGGKA
jgi:glycosyltransferase involved in cell wall biosynthesis